MHGRAKSSAQSVSAEEASGKKTQIHKYIQAKDLFLNRRNGRVLDDKSRELTAKLIELNPDLYPLWNFRRDIFQHIVQQQSATQTHTSHTTAQSRSERGVLMR
jgi:hypothetical protein